MKRIFFIATIMLLSVTAIAQNNNWQKPTDTQQQEKRGLFDRNKSKKEIEPKYMQGGVPEVDGKVTWVKEIAVPGKTAAQIYDILLPYFQQFVKEKGQLEQSQVAVVNKETAQIGVRAQEWLVFENKLLSLDQTKFLYTIMTDCSDGKAKITITHLSYRYEEGFPGELKTTAEEWIADKVAFNKKGTGFQKGGVRKFRTKTIDRMEAVLAGIEAELTK